MVDVVIMSVIILLFVAVFGYAVYSISRILEKVNSFAENCEGSDYER
jgi:hypothetical protein